MEVVLSGDCDAYDRVCKGEASSNSSSSCAACATSNQTRHNLPFPENHSSTSFTSTSTHPAQLANRVTTHTFKVHSGLVHTLRSLLEDNRSE